MLAIKFLNDTTGDLKKANYKYEVVVTQTRKDGKLDVIKIAEGEVKGHFRDDGWEGLVKKLSDQLQKEESNKPKNISADLDSLSFHTERVNDDQVQSVVSFKLEY